MFCNNCGAKLEEKTKFCDHCGAAVDIASHDKKKTQMIDLSKGLLFATIAIALINAIIPFLHWVEIPALNTFSSWLGGSSTAASYTLFGYIFAGESDSTIATIVIFVLALIALVSVVFNVLYCVKAFQGKNGAEKYGKTGSILLLIMSVLFFTVVGLISLIIKVIKLTSAVYISIVFSIVNIVLINKLKK